MRQNLESGFIKNIIIIVIILTVVFFSQQESFKPLMSQTTLKAQEYLKGYNKQASDWATAKILPRASQEVENRGESVQKAIETEKNNVTQNLWDNVKNYSAQKFSQIFNTQVECK